MRTSLVFAVIGLLLSVAVIAAPAPWYKWKSIATGEEYCAQFSLGEGWEQASGPYKDANCKISGRPG